MSWLFSQALVEAYSADTCSDGAQSAPSSGNPTPQAFLPPDRMTAFSRPSRFGMTFKPLTDGLGAAVLMWCQEASRARTSASQAKEPALTEPAAECGDTWRGSLARFDPATSSWRTAQPSLLEDLGESSVIWPRSGMTANGQCWELPTLGHRTSGTDSGWWLGTPTAAMSVRSEDFKRPGMTPSEFVEAYPERGMWPTPTVCGNYNRKGASASSGDGLATAVAKWPTPQASDNRPRGTQKTTARRMAIGKQVGLEAMVKWTTPTAHNSKEGGFPSEHQRNTPTLAAQAGGSLNPTWVEWLMGWPLGWTDLKPLATGKSPFVPQQHSNY